MAITYATWNPSDKGANIALSGGDLIASSSVAGYQSVRANISKSTGKHAFEYTRSQLNNQAMLGFGDSGFSLSNHLGATAKSVGMQGGTGFQTNGITVIGYADYNALIYMFALDIDAGKGWICSYGVWANSGNPAAGTNPSFTFTPGTILFPAITVTNNGSQTVILNSGQSAFTNTSPAGFNAGWFDNTNSIPAILNTRREL